MKPLLFTEIELPRATVQRIMKTSSDGRLMQKDAKLACTKAGTVFISAQEFTTQSGQKTLSASHVLQAVEAIGFGPEFMSVLTEALENHKKQTLQAKEARAAASQSTVDNAVDEDEAGHAVVHVLDTDGESMNNGSDIDSSNGNEKNDHDHDHDNDNTQLPDDY